MTPEHYFNGKAIRLIRHAPVTDEQACKLAVLFDQAWNQIPERYRELIMTYWQGRLAPAECRSMLNVREPYDTRITLYPNRELPRTMSDGHSLLFYAPTFEELGDSLSVIAIAHELAHVTFYAEGEPNHWPNQRTEQTDQGAEELVDRLVREWGWNHATLLARTEEFEELER